MEHFYQNIHGWSTIEDQGELLKTILPQIDDLKFLRIAEIGVYKGRGTAMWNVELINRNLTYEYYAIDNFEGSLEHKFSQQEPTLNEAISNLEIIKDKIKIIKSDSIEASKNFKDNYFDIVYIDASHEYEFVIKDITNWFPKVKKNGIICGDDYIAGWPGVVKAVDEYFKDFKNVKINRVGVQQWWVKK